MKVDDNGLARKNRNPLLNFERPDRDMYYKTAAVERLPQAKRAIVIACEVQMSF